MRPPSLAFATILFTVSLVGPWATSAEPLAAKSVALKVDPGKVLHRIDEKVYGHFLEHIYFSCNGGLWGELVWNRSFEQNDAGEWSVRDGLVVQESLATNQRFPFGDPLWRDYELTVEAKKTGGTEGFLVLFRVKSEEEFYWCNLGGWGNERHAIERGRRGSRWGVVGPSVRGSIESGRWYRIRVRCEGRRFRVWLDDALVVDFTDDAGAHLEGRVGVGTWATTAEFRNFKVTDLEGKVLYEGAPRELSARSSVASRWKLFGEGGAEIDRAVPLNNRFSQRIESRGAEAGVEQTPFCVTDGATYVGSLWARGRAPNGLVVRLVDGKTVLAQAKLPAPIDEWHELPFRLVPESSCADATLQVGVLGQGSVSFDQVSLMPQLWKDAGGFRPDLLGAIADLKPPIIRWPGGCFASAYRWKDGIGPQSKRGVYPREIWDDLDVNSFGTDEFVAMCRRVGAEPLIVINIGTANWNGDVDEGAFLQEALDWVEYCNGPADSKWGKVRASNGHPEPYGVKYWEIDNETWHLGAERYAEAVRRFAPALRKADSTIRLAACGSGGYGRGASDWNRTIVDRCAELVDYLSIHHYENPNSYAGGPRAYESFFRDTGKLIADSKNPELKIYVSEWNVQSTDWRTGLYAGGLLNAFERCGDVLEIGGPALFLRHVSATAWDNAFINFDSCSWFPAPNYVVMRLWREHFGPERILLEGKDAPLNVVASRSPDGRTLYVKAVNPSDESIDLNLSVGADFRVGRATFQLVAPGSLDARNTMDSPRTIRPTDAPAAVDGSRVRVSLPPLSAGVVSIRAR